LDIALRFVSSFQRLCGIFIYSSEYVHTVFMDGEAAKSDWAALRSVYNSAFLCSLGFFFVSFLLPIIAFGMGASGLEVALLFSLLTLGSALFSPLAGKLAKKGRRRSAIFFGASVRALAYIGTACAIWINSIPLLIGNSLIWGIGVAFYVVGSDAEISERVTRENRSEAFGHRAAANARGNIIGTFVGFTIFFMFDVYTVFIFYAIMNVFGGIVVISDRPPLKLKPITLLPEVQGILAKGIVALVFAAAIDAFALALLSPFVELYVLFSFPGIRIELLALAYLPSGIISAMVGGPIGKFADKSNKVLIVSGSALIVSVSTFLLALLPQFATTVEMGVLWVGVLFTIEGVAGTTAYMVMSSVLGTAYEGRASEGFGIFESAMGLARFSGPIAGGLIWDYVSPAAPFIFVGLAELLLIPAYYIGMRHYQEAILRTSREAPAIADE
jgi:MFS family permease